MRRSRTTSKRRGRGMRRFRRSIRRRRSRFSNAKKQQIPRYARNDSWGLVVSEVGKGSEIFALFFLWHLLLSVGGPGDFEGDVWRAAAWDVGQEANGAAGIFERQAGLGCG